LNYSILSSVRLLKNYIHTIDFSMLYTVIANEIKQNIPQCTLIYKW